MLPCSLAEPLVDGPIYKTSLQKPDDDTWCTKASISPLFSESCGSVVPAPKRNSSCCSTSGSWNAPVIAAEDPETHTFCCQQTISTGQLMHAGSQWLSRHRAAQVVVSLGGGRAGACLAPFRAASPRETRDQNTFRVHSSRSAPRDPHL